MGHYCRICGRTRANEKFSGKGHKNHICKNCSKECNRKGNKTKSNKSDLAQDTGMISEYGGSRRVNLEYEDIYFDEVCQGISDMHIVDEGEVPF